MFFVRSTEIIPCPCCGEVLEIIGSRKRIWKQSSGETQWIHIRRKRCSLCEKIHHELPNVLVPFKHYDAASIEAVTTASEYLDVAVDESTIHRWRTWIMAWVTYAAAILESLSIRYNIAKAAPCTTSISVLRPLVRFVGTAAGWLARAVRPIVNSNEWTHT